MKLDVLSAGLFFEPHSQSGIGRDAASDAQGLQADLSQGKKGLAEKAIDDRLLETGRDIGDLLVIKVDLREIGTTRPGDLIANGRL